MLLSPRAILAVPAAIVTAAVLITCSGDRTIGPGGPAGSGVMASVGTVVGQVLVGAGDIARCDRQNDEATASILDTIPGSVFTVGDNVLGGSSSPPDFVNCYGPSWGRHKARTRPTIGHMEGFSPGSATYTQYFGAAAGDPGKFYYSYDLGGWHIVVLNSGISTTAGSTQEQWLKADLAAHPAQCTLAMWHAPRFSSTSGNGQPAVNDAVKPLWDDLYAAGAEIVINAHYEVYERFAPQKPSGTADAQIGIRQFTVGTGGIGVNSFNGATAANSEVHNSGTPGVLKLTLGSNGYAWQFIPINGFTFTDVGTGDCHGNTPGPAVASVDVSPNPASVEVGLDVQMTGTPKDAAGNPLADRLVTWSSSNTSVAKVTGDGDVFGWAEGTATITATSDGVSGSSTVTVVSTTAAVLVGAGDVAVCNAPEDEATAALLDNIQGTVFTAGDNAYPDGSATQFTNCYQPSWGRHKARTRPGTGNHDYTTAGAPAYFSYFGAAAGDPTKGYYSYDLGAWHVIAINNYVDASAGSPQEQWLKADLAASSKQCTAAIWHEPTFSSGSIHASGNTDWLALWRDLYQAGADIIINGHEHTYERFAPMTPNGVADPTTGIREFVVGTGGAGLEALGTIQPNSEVVQNSAHGVLRLVLRPTGYQWRFFPVAGQTFSDTGSAPCHGPPGNLPPAASFTSSCSGLTCHFTDTSIDPDGSVAAWSWSLGDGTTSTDQSPGHVYAAGGTYTVSLTVTDNKGTTNSKSQSVTVTPPNTPPTAAFTQTCTGLACSFTSTSTDPDGSVVGWSWSFGDAATATVANPSHTYAAGGTYTVNLTATDNSGATGSTSQSITVTPPNTPPTAAFTQTCTGLACSFTSTSTDADGTVVGWSWSFGDGATATVANPSHTYAAGGTFTVGLTVTDNSGGTGSSSQSITVTPANTAPTAAFTQSCTGLACSFTSTSTDPDGTVVGWSWSFGDGATATVANPAHTYATGGTYTVNLTATDNSGGTGSTSQSVTVTAPNTPPTAAFTSSCTGLACSFTSTSTDPDGSVVGWSWSFGDGATATVANPSHTYAAGGTYTVNLTATDNSGGTGSTSQSITVAAANTSPTAAFTQSCTGLACSFTSTSTDPDGTVVAWSWSFGDGATATVANPSHTYAAGGTFTVSLTVTDNSGGTGSTSQNITVTPPNTPPTAAFTRSCTGLACSFTSTSTDPDGSVVAWSWSFGDGVTATVANPSHTYAAGGTYTVSLTVTDNSGAPGSTSQSITVTPPNQPPTAAFTRSCTGLACSFTSTSTDPDGSVVAWSWSFGDGATATVANPSHTYAGGGTYTVSLTVTDNSNATGSTSQSVTVTAPNLPPTASFTKACGDLSCNFASTSTDPDGVVVAWSWNFGDGATATGANPSHNYAVGGTYTVSLTVTDNAGATNTTSQAVTVTAPVGAQVLVGAGDIARCDRQNDEATAALLDGIAGAVFTVGDNVLGGSTSPPDFVNCYDPSWGRHKARTRPAIGHMEGFSPGSATYTQYFGAAAGDAGKFYYSYDVGSWHVVVLNNNISTSAGSPQELWLRADLTAHPTQCALAIWHLPRFSSTSSSGLPVVNAAVKPLWDDLYAAGAEIVINAHYEVYERFAPQTSSGTADPQLGIRQFTVGTGGIGVNSFGGGTAANSEVHNSGTPGVLKLTLAANSYSWQFIPIAGFSFTDSGSGACH